MRSRIVAGLATLALAASLRAQDSGTTVPKPSVKRPSCEGHTVTAIAINPGRPPFAGSARKWQLAARALGLHHATTRPDVIRSYLLLQEGSACTDARVTESERIVRGLPFLSDANITVRFDSTGGAMLDVSTTDEIPVLASGGIRHGRPAALTLGSENVAGLGLRMSGGIASHSPYRTSSFFEAIDYAPFDIPIVARARVGREELGNYAEFEATRLFLSNFQRGAWSATYRIGDDFPRTTRPRGDDQAVEVRNERWSAGGVIRSSFGRVVALWGPVVLGNRISPATTSIIASDSGAFPGNDSALVARYSAFHSARLGGVFGARNVRYVTRTGLDALFGQQDVMVGWQLGALAAPGVTANAGRDLLLGQTIYLGGATRSLVGIADVESEARRDFTFKKWDSNVTNVHAIGYYQLHPQVLVQLEDNFSSLVGTRLPAQLSLDEPEAGARGYHGSSIVGARRNLIRAELRAAHPALIHNADLGVALFGDAATMWAGDAPYGQSATRRSVGVSLLGSFPSRSKRLYRLDFAYAAQRNARHGLEIRFTSGDRTSRSAVEPNDVSDARLAPIPSSLFAWPGR